MPGVGPCCLGLIPECLPSRPPWPSWSRRPVPLGFRSAELAWAWGGGAVQSLSGK